MIVRLSAVNAVETVSVLHVESIIGAGDKDDPVRTVHEWFTPNGCLIVRRDSWTGELTDGSPVR